MITHASDKLFLVEQLRSQLVEISAAPSTKLHELLKIYDYLSSLFVSRDHSTAEECQAFVNLFEKNIAPLLFEQGYYAVLAEKFAALQDMLNKKADAGKLVEQQALLPVKLDYDDKKRAVPERRFTPPPTSYGILTPEEFTSVKEQLVQSFNSAYQFANKSSYFIALSKRIHLLLPGFKTADSSERCQHITDALQLCLEGLAFCKQEKNEHYEKYFEELIDICFGYYFLIHAKTTVLSKLPLCVSGLAKRSNRANKVETMRRVCQSADLIIAHAVMMARDENYGREDFIFLALEEAQRLYELAIHWVKDDYAVPNRAEFVEKGIQKLFCIHQCQGKREYIKKMAVEKHETVALLPWRENQKKLKNLRTQTEIKLNQEPIGNSLAIVAEFNQGLKHGIQQLFEQCIAFVGKKILFDYVMLGFGSLARDEACPFSDVEFGFLVDSIESLEKNQGHIQVILNLFKLCIIALGETPSEGSSCIKSGLRLDDIFTPFYEKNKLLGTADELASRHKGVGNMTLGAIQTACILAKSKKGEELYQTFQEELKKQRNQSNLRNNFAASIISENAMNPELMPFALDEFKIHTIKENLLRPLVFLCMVLNATEALDELTTLKRLKKLEQREKINPAIAEMIKLYFGFALHLRFLAHFHYGYDHEVVYLKPTPKLASALDTDKPFYLTEDKDKKSYDILMSFRQSIMVLLSECFKKPDTLALQLPEQHPAVIPAILRIADDYFNKNQWKNAFTYYRLILDACPLNLDKEQSEKEMSTLLETQFEILLTQNNLPAVLKENLTLYLKKEALCWDLIHEEWCKEQARMTFPCWAATLSSRSNQGLRLFCMASGYLMEEPIKGEGIKSLYLHFLDLGEEKLFFRELASWHPKQTTSSSSETFELSMMLKMYYGLALDKRSGLEDIVTILLKQNKLSVVLGCFLQKMVKTPKELSNQSQWQHLQSLLLLLQKIIRYAFQQQELLSKGLTLEQLMGGYFLESLPDDNAQENYQKWFMDVTLYLLYTQAPLETHRHYYRKLPEHHRNECLVFAKNYVESCKNKSDWLQSQAFWIKLWDAPLSDGERHSHQELKSQWATRLKKNFTITASSTKTNYLKVDITGIKAGHFFLSPLITNELLEKKWLTASGKFTQKKEHPIAKRMPGNHLVIPWPLPSEKNVEIILLQKSKAEEEIRAELLQEIQANAQFYFKIYPEYPLMELFLNELTYRLGYYPPREVDLWRWQYADVSYPILVSEAVRGNTLQALLKNTTPLQLNAQAFSQSMVISALTCQEDNKPDNSIVCSDPVEGPRICLIDADRWFVPAFKDNRLHVKEILFCLSEMNSSVDPVFREEFLSINPQSLLQAWVNQMESWGNQCIIVFGNKIEEYFTGWLRKDDRKTLLLPPLKFHAIHDLFDHMQLLQDVLLSSHESSSVSHWRLLSKINSRLANHYLLAHEKNTNPSSSIERFESLTRHGYSRGKGNQQEYFTSKIDFKTQMQDMWEGLTDENDIQKNWARDITLAKAQLPQFIEKIEKIREARNELKQGNTDKFKNLSLRGKEKFLSHLDWLTLTPKIQRFLINFMISQGNWLNITIYNSHEIKDNDMQALLQKSPALKRLVLTDCPPLSETVWISLLQNTYPLKVLSLKNLEKMKYLGYVANFPLYGEQCLLLPNLEILSIIGCSQLQQININAGELQKIVFRDGPHQYHPKLKIVRTQSKKLENEDLLNGYINYQNLLFLIIHTLEKINKDEEFKEKKAKITMDGYRKTQKPPVEKSTTTVVSSNSAITSTYQANRKGIGLSDIQLNDIICLPKHYKLGLAVDNGGCFFDSLAQSMNEIHRTDVNTEKYLRRLCHDFYLENKEAVNQWNTNDYGGIDKDNYWRISYTAKECEEDLNQAAPLGGRPWIEGRILCHQLKLEGICIIEILENPETKTPVIRFHLVTQDSYKTIDEAGANHWMNSGKVPVLVVEQNSLHFVPILSGKQSAINNPLHETKVKPKNSIKHLENRNLEMRAALEKTLDDTNPGMRVEAAATLIKLGHSSSKAIQVLIEEATNALYVEVKISALQQLGEVQEISIEIIGALIEALKDLDSYPVRIQAAESLEKIAQTLKNQIEQLFNSSEKEAVSPLTKAAKTTSLRENYQGSGIFRVKREIPEDRAVNDAQIPPIPPRKSQPLHPS